MSKRHHSAGPEFYLHLEEQIATCRNEANAARGYVRYQTQLCTNRGDLVVTVQERDEADGPVTRATDYRVFGDDPLKAALRTGMGLAPTPQDVPPAVPVVTLTLTRQTADALHTVLTALSELPGEALGELHRTVHDAVNTGAGAWER